MVPDTPKPPGTAAPTQLNGMKIARLGDYHPADRCWLCGCLSSGAELRETTVRMTFARGVACVDVVACAHRRRMAA